MAEVEKLIGSEGPLEIGQKINEIIEKGVGGAGLQMFDTILKDHILTYEESKGLAPQGTYVYKEAIAGSRYGYPDFYAKCLEEYSEAISTETVNDVIVKVHSNGHKFYDIADKEAIDNFFNAMGTAWFYGVDTENECVFLPRNIYFDQVTNNISEVGNSVSAGLPNITATATGTGGWGSASGAFTISNTGHRGTGTDSSPRTLSFDASLSSPIYGNSDTVQPNAVKKLLYICVGNTEASTAVTDVVEVTSSENDTIPLFTGMYFDFTPNNISWLKAGEQVNSGDVYKTAYNELVNEVISPKYGLKVINESNMESGVDYSLYWKINQANITFTTPDAISDKNLNSTAKLYFKVANAVQNLELLDAAKVLESVNEVNANSVNKTNQADINIVLDWVMPDYTNSILISVTSTTSYTAPANGYIFGSFNFAGATEGLVYINGVPIGTSNQNGQISVIPISKGDVLTAAGTENDQVYFCPMKGAKNN